MKEVGALTICLQKIKENQKKIINTHGNVGVFIFRQRRR